MFQFQVRHHHHYYLCCLFNKGFLMIEVQNTLYGSFGQNLRQISSWLLALRPYFLGIWGLSRREIRRLAQSHYTFSLRSTPQFAHTCPSRRPNRLQREQKCTQWKERRKIAKLTRGLACPARSTSANSVTQGRVKDRRQKPKARDICMPKPIQVHF